MTKYNNKQIKYNDLKNNSNKITNKSIKNKMK